MLPIICVDGLEKTPRKDGPVSGAAVAGLGRLLLRGLDSVTVIARYRDACEGHENTLVASILPSPGSITALLASISKY